MTEEGLPLLILFYNPDEPEVKEEFKERVMSELAEFKGEDAASYIRPGGRS